MELEEKPTPFRQQSRDRKSSDMKAVGDNPVDDREKAGRDKKASNNSSEVVDIDGSSVTIIENRPFTTFYTQETPQGKAETPETEKWGDFAQNTSLHGFRNMFFRASLYVRILWLILLLASTGLILYFMYRSFSKYFQYPIATVMRIQYPDTMVFPAVTLCPMTKFTKNKIFMTDDDVMFQSLGLDLPVCNATAHVRKGRPCGEALLCCCASYFQDVSVALSNCTEEYKRELLDVIMKDKKSFNDKKFQEAYGPNLQRNLACRFGLLDYKCTGKDFLPTVTELGLCFTFNSGRNDKEIKKVSRSDSVRELHLELDLHLDDHLAGFFSEGIFVIIHDQGVYINSADTVLVAPGSYVRINVKRKVYRNKKSPYETKCTETKNLAGFLKYDSDGCYYECLSNTTGKKCGCRLPSLVDSDRMSERICFRDDFPCVFKVYEDLVSGNQCECPLACEVVKYETKTSAAAFPSPLLIKHWKMQGVNKTDDYLRKNLIMLQVGYTSLSYEHFKQTSQYDSTALMGEIGGTLGLFLGCSVLTVIEFIDFAIYLCYIRKKKTS